MVWIYSVLLTAGASEWTIVAAAFPALLVVLVFLCRGRRRRYAIALALSAACFAHGLVSRVTFDCDHEHVRRRAAADRKVVVEGRVSGFPEQRRVGVRFPFDTSLDGQPVKLLVTAVAFGVGYGDSLKLAGTLSPGRSDRRLYLASRGACGYLRASKAGVVSKSSRPSNADPRRWAWRAHESVRRLLAMNLGSRAGLPTALAIGDRGGVRNSLRTAFSRLGISHLLALSGLHLGMVAGLVVAVLRLAGRRRHTPLLLILTVYVCVVGDVVSLHRAYAMAVVLILAARAERPARPLSALGCALFVLLLARPALTHSVAFQLSFTATLAVLLCVTTFPLARGGGRLRRLASTVLSTLVVGACVQLFLLPLQLRYFGGSCLLTPVATLLFLPPVALLMFFTGLALAVGWAPAPVTTAAFGTLGALTAAFEQALLAASSWAPGLAGLREPDIIVYYVGLGLYWLRPKGAWAAARLVVGAGVCLLAFHPF